MSVKDPTAQSAQDADTQSATDVAAQVMDLTNYAAAPPLEQMHPSEPERGSQPMLPPEEVQRYDAQGRMTREGMLDVIRQGGSVGVWRNAPQPDGSTKRAYQIVWRLQDLPDELEVAGDDPVRQKVALDKMERQRAALERRIKAHKAQQGSTGTNTQG